MHASSSYTPTRSLLRFDGDFFFGPLFFAALFLDLGGPPVKRTLPSRQVENHGLDRVCDGLATLPQREKADAERAAEEPEDANDHPA